jgi:hypothetical protein
MLQVNVQSRGERFGSKNVARAAVLAAASVGALASIPVIFGSPLPQIHIQWHEINDDQRVLLEGRFALTEATRLGDDVWSYVPTDTSRERLFAIVSNGAVADTNGINRRTFSISDTPPLTERRGGLVRAPRWAVGATRIFAYVLALISAMFLGGATLPFFRESRLAGRVAARGIVLPESLRFAARNIAVRWPVVATAAAAFIATLAWRFVTFTGFTNDHYVHLALAQQMLMGERPVRDFADSGWPLMYLLSAAAWRATGDALATEWAIAAGAFALGAACTVVAAYRLSASLAIAVLVTTVEVLIYPRTYSYPKVLAYAVASWAMVPLASRPSRQRVALMSVIVAVAFLLRHDHGLFIGVGAAVCLAVAGGLARWQDALQRIGVLTGMTAVFLLPWAVFVALNGGLLPYFQGGIEYSRAEAAATSLTTPPLLSLGTPVNTIANAEAWLFWLFWGITVVCGAVLVVRVLRGRERWTGEAGAVAGVATMAVLVNASFVRQALQVRLPDAVVPAAVLGAWALGLCWTAQWRLRTLQRVVQLATVGVLMVSLAALGRITDLAGQYDNTDVGRGPARATEHAQEVAGLVLSRHRDNLSPPSRVSRALMPFIAYLDRCTSTSDRLIVTGEFPEVLVIAGRKFAGDGVVFGSWYASEVHQDRTVEQLLMSPPLFVIHAGDYEGFRGRFPLVDRFATGAYEPFTEIPVEGTGNARILVHRDRVPVRTDAATGWRCFR